MWLSGRLYCCWYKAAPPLTLKLIVQVSFSLSMMWCLWVDLSDSRSGIICPYYTNSTDNSVSMTGIPSVTGQQLPVSGSHWFPRRSLWCERRGSAFRRACPTHNPSHPGPESPDVKYKQSKCCKTCLEGFFCIFCLLLCSYLMGAECGRFRRRQFGHGCFLREITSGSWMLHRKNDKLIKSVATLYLGEGFLWVSKKCSLPSEQASAFYCHSHVSQFELKQCEKILD